MLSLYAWKWEVEFLWSPNRTALISWPDSSDWIHRGNVETRMHHGWKWGWNGMMNVVTSVWPADSRLSCFWRILFMRSKKSPFPLATLEIETDQFSCETFHPCLHLITRCGFKKSFPSSRVWAEFFIYIFICSPYLCFTVISIAYMLKAHLDLWSAAHSH